MKRLEGKVAVVTGGNSGIGLATAKRLQEEGARVAIAGRSKKTLDEAAKTIGNGVLAVQVDVAKLADVDRLYAEVSKKFGKIDVLFVNAGVAKFAPLAMNETMYRPPASLIPRIAPTEVDPRRGGLVRGKVHDERAYYLGGVSAHAGIFSSAHDLSRFARMYLNGGALESPGEFFADPWPGSSAGLGLHGSVDSSAA